MKHLPGILLGAIIGLGVTWLYFHNHERRGVIGSVKFAKEGSHIIPFEEAQSMHKAYMLKCSEAGEDTLSETLRYLSVNRSDIDSLLKNIPADGTLRIYMGDISGRNGFASSNELTTFLVGTDKDGNLQTKNAKLDVTKATTDIVDNLPPCPDDCPNGPNNPPGDGFN